VLFVTVACTGITIDAAAGESARDRASEIAKPKALDDSQIKAGQALYRNGVLLSGGMLKSVREGGIVTEGEDAACVNCHRRSGLGAKEGRGAIPPITGRYLFRPRSAAVDENEALPFVEGMRGEREPYTDTTLARAIREGLDSEGKPLTYLMPHFVLQEQDMAALIAYLKNMDPRRVPGVHDKVMHFATIITPDADPVKRRGMLDVIEQFFADRNATQMGAAPRMRSSNKTAYSRSMNMVHRQWTLHVWELQGAESTWEEQLEQRFAKEPVFATVSGLGGKNWGPIHAFCEKKALPCLFPNVEVPPAEADHDFYSLYLNRGVLLESALIATRIRSMERPVKTVRQVYRDGDGGVVGADALAAALKKDGVTLINQVIASDAPAGKLVDAIQGPSDILVLWLRPADISELPSPPAESTTVFLSGLLGGLERAPLPAAWRSRTHMAYGFDLPDKRRVRVDYALGWFRMRKIPVVAEQVQADTYLALGLLSETLKHMVDAFIPDYVVERTQDILEHRVITGYYPRLTMASGQRFASKGGYMVHLADDKGTRVVAEQEWIVP
jgi:mono/diheme cytochrome c family protein